MVAVGVRDEDRAHRLVAHGIEQRADMRGIVGPRIDDGDFAFADDVAERALEGERARIIGHHTAHARYHLVDRVGREFEIFIEGDVVGHALSNVMRGLDPRIPFRLALCVHKRDGRDKPGHDRCLMNLRFRHRAERA